MVELEKKEVERIPEKTGFYYLSGSEGILFAGKTSNLQKSIRRILFPDKDDKNLFQLASLTQKIFFRETDSLFNALLEEKKILQTHAPEFNRMIHEYENYVYLAIDFNQIPFLRISDSTAENFYYLGPFQDRFFLYDFFDAMTCLFRFPFCETEKYPCDKLTEKICDSWCLKERPEIMELLINSYLLVNRSLLKKAENQRGKMLEHLNFLKLETLKEQISLIERYYDYLRFFHITKKLKTAISLPDKNITISGGMISKIEEKGKMRTFDNFQPDHRRNELLAHDKNQFTERLIIYRELKKNRLNPIELILKDSSEEMKKNLV